MADRIDVMISSTARDLPDHRQQAMDACLRMGMFPVMMEHLPPSDDEAIAASLKMVDDAEIYVGIYAYRYGYVPKGHAVSVTEMEYDRAVKNDIPRLIFVMHKDHPITGADVETGAATQLDAFKKRVMAENIVNEFKSPEDLRAQIIHGLSAHRQPDASLHPPLRDLPTPPDPYIAHPYTLLQTSQLAGRQAELNLLTDWVAQPRSEVYRARILNVVAIGGMGKSALTWKWFNDIAPLEMKPLAGRLWWSFYESDAYFENFVTRALAYVSRQPREEIEKLPTPEREDRLLAILDREPFLLVLDGLERILIAYARMDAAYLRDDELDEQAANYVAGALGLPESAAQSFIGQHRLRKTADPRAGNFLRKLASVKAARILVSTRLYPADLQDTHSGESLLGSVALFLTGLRDDDALELWRAFNVSGSRDDLLRIFHTFQNYPLLIRALVGEIKRDRRAAGDFDTWQRNNPDFNPFRELPLVQTKSHVLQFALQGLDAPSLKVLHTVAAFRMPTTYDTLVALLVGEPSPPAPLPQGEGGEESPGEATLPREPRPGDPSGKGTEGWPGEEATGIGAGRAVLSGELTEDEQVERFRERASEVMVQLARELRKKETSAEDRLWTCLRDRRLVDLKFRRQHPIAKTAYVVDFFCYARKLVIELDGDIHDRQQEADALRQQEIEALGYIVLRFRNEQVFDDLQTVLATIAEACSPPAATPARTDFPASSNAVSPLPATGGSPFGKGEGPGVRVKPFPTEPALDAALTELEDRGLLGWDKSTNRYDLHPIVRGVSWDTLDADAKRGVYQTLHAHFEAAPTIDEDDVERLEDLTPAIELYNTLIGLGRYDDAGLLFYERLDGATLYRLSASRHRAELLEMLFPDGLNQFPRHSDPKAQAFILNSLALAYQLSGQPGRAAPLFRQNVIIREKESNPSVGLGNLSEALRFAGALREAEFAARRALHITREQDDRFAEAVVLSLLGLALAARGLDSPLPRGEGQGVRATAALHRPLRIDTTRDDIQGQCVDNAHLAQAVLWRGDPGAARPLADRAWELAHVQRVERDFIVAARLQGEAALGLNDFATADERLHHALTRARAVNHVQEELPALIALAELHRRRSQPEQARTLLDDVWEAAERGPYPLFHADALNVLAQLERDAGNTDKAIETATKAYTKAWCDGISVDGQTCYAYWWGLKRAREHLDALGAPYPDLPPFDESQHPPLPDVEINPHDEFHVDEDDLP